MFNYQDVAKRNNMNITFVHLASNLLVEFPAFLTEFSDQYSVSWGSEAVYGRMDPIKPYQGTTRTLSVAFDVLSYNLDNAKDNFYKYNKLIQMLYPAYSEPLASGNKRARTLKAPPIMRVKFANLIANSDGASADKGLVGCISGFTFNPKREVGWFIEKDSLLPKVFNISFNFDPQHEHTLGWEKNKFLGDGFPYGRTSLASGKKVDTSAGIADVKAARAKTVTGG